MTIRIARICEKCNTREFGNPKWTCPQHPRATVTQPNRPYFGKPTPSLRSAA